MLSKYSHIYFIGIGGIGMSALARYLHDTGKHVAGYDKTETPLTRSLEQTGIPVIYSDITDLIPAEYKKPGVLVVYTPAVKKAENSILSYYSNGNFRVVKRAELLGIISSEKICLAVAGTHGKTTTSSLLAHILIRNAYPVTAFLGGIVAGYNSNILHYGDQYMVVEADEYDRSFLHLHPRHAVITSMDADHPDIYQRVAEMKKAFKQFAGQVSGNLIYREGLPFTGLSYGLDGTGEVTANRIHIKEGKYYADMESPFGNFTHVVFPLPGKHNVLNALAAFSIAAQLGIKGGDIIEAWRDFPGIERRFQIRYRSRNRILIDDYAHHPAELRALLNTAKEIFPGEKILIVFQPHTYTRTAEYMDDFADVLSAFDLPLILPVYAAREHSIAGASSRDLTEKIRKRNTEVKYIDKEDMIKETEAADIRIQIIAGAGDIGDTVAGMVNYLKQTRK